MLIQTGAEIGEFNYTFWSGNPATPNAHAIHYVPQTIADGWDAFCSCGQWRGFANFREFDTKDALFAGLKEAWASHLAHGSSI